MTDACQLCGGACANADLTPLLDERLAWLWERLAAVADRQGDAHLISGMVTIRAPADAETRAAAGGLLGGRPLRPGQRRRVELAALAEAIRTRGVALTPGAVAAHWAGRPLAARSRADHARACVEATLLDLVRAGAGVVAGDPEAICAMLKRTGWIARILADPEPAGVIRTAFKVVSRLPRDGSRVDRRVLASEVTSNPHGLDDGALLAGLVLAVLTAAGRVQPRQRPRNSWAEVGVDCDDVVGGLLAVGLVPAGWTVPAGTIVTLPPRVLRDCEWPIATAGAWVFVTENPSVAAAAADLAGDGHAIQLLCTMGTPSACEIAAIDRLARRGWRVAVRADFDAAGLRHVTALLAGVPGAVPWRMRVSDYQASLPGERPVRQIDRVGQEETPWETALAAAMTAAGVPAFEEALLEQLVGDLRRGAPVTT